MDFFVSCFAVYFITTSVMLGEVATNLQAPSKENLITIANNEQIPLAAETRSDSKIDSRPKSARFQTRSRRSTYIEEDETLVDKITGLVLANEREAILNEIQKNGIQVATNNRTEIVKWIVINKYEEVDSSRDFFAFIKRSVHQLDEQCIWLNALYETMKMKNELVGLRGIRLEEMTRLASEALSKVNYPFDYDHQECNLQLLADAVYNDVIEPIQRRGAEWVKHIQSGNDNDIVNFTCCESYDSRKEFEFFIPQLIKTAIGLNYSEHESNDNFAKRFEKVIHFITTRIIEIPLIANIALTQLIKILDNIEPHFIPMRERISLSYVVHDLEDHAKNVQIVLFESTTLQGIISYEPRKEFLALANKIQLNIKRIVWDPYVFIYKNEIDGTRKFMSFDRSKKNIKNNKFVAHLEEFNKPDERNQWVLEPINYVDQFRIKNKESGEYLYADDDSSLDDFTKKRPVFTHKLDNKKNNTLGDRMIWVVTRLFESDGAERFTIMNLHWKEYLDSNESDSLSQVYTWKNISNSPKSARDWIISDSDNELEKTIISIKRPVPAPKIELKERRLVCFFNSNATQREVHEGTGHFTTDNIDPSLCTHLIYSKARIDNVNFTMAVGDEKIDIIDKGYEKIVALKNKNPDLKVMIYLDIWETLKAKSRFFSSNVTINTLVESTVNFLQKYQFDGVHFNFPVTHAALTVRRVTRLLKALNETFRSRTNLILSANIGRREQHVIEAFGSFLRSNEYDISHFSDMLDFIGVNTYNMHDHDLKTFSKKKVDHHDPLFFRPWEEPETAGYDGSLNADLKVREMISAGASPKKIVLGIPFFGIGFTLASNITNPPIGTFREEQVQIPYREICKVVGKEGWKVVQDPFRRMGPYAVSPPKKRRTWIGYDDPAMAMVKANYILSNGLGGAYVNDISNDDFLNTCGGGFNPMLTAIANTLGIKASDSTSV